MADKNKDDKVAVKVGGPYVENEDHVPASTDLYGQFATHGLGGNDHDPHFPTPVFRAGRAQAILDAAKTVAADALDDVSGALAPVEKVVFSVAEKTDEARKALQAEADAIRNQPVVVGGPSPAQQAAAEEGPAVASSSDPAVSPRSNGAPTDGSAKSKDANK